MLQDKTILITGANRGIGRATAKACIEAGATVYLAGRDDQGLEQLAETLGENAIVFSYELTDAEQVKQAFAHLMKYAGKLDGLVNNAGTMIDAPLAMTRLEDLQHQLQINTVTSFHHTQLASRLMARQNSGSIVNLCSVVGEAGSAGQSAYATSKAALSGMIRSLAKELGPAGIRVNGVAPGFIDTDLTAAYAGQQRDAVISRIDLGRAGRAEEVADLICYLLSDKGAYITGQIIAIDGGLNL